MLMLHHKLPEVVATPTTADGLVEDVEVKATRKTCEYVGGYGYYS